MSLLVGFLFLRVSTYESGWLKGTAVFFGWGFLALGIAIAAEDMIIQLPHLLARFM